MVPILYSTGACQLITSEVSRRQQANLAIKRQKVIAYAKETARPEAGVTLALDSAFLKQCKRLLKSEIKCNNSYLTRDLSQDISIIPDSQAFTKRDGDDVVPAVKYIVPTGAVLRGPE